MYDKFGVSVKTVVVVCLNQAVYFILFFLRVCSFSTITLYYSSWTTPSWTQHFVGTIRNLVSWLYSRVLLEITFNYLNLFKIKWSSITQFGLLISYWISFWTQRLINSWVCIKYEWYQLRCYSHWIASTVLWSKN